MSLLTIMGRNRFLYTKNPTEQTDLHVVIGNHAVLGMKEIAAIFGTTEEQAAEILARYTLERRGAGTHVERTTE